MGEMFKNTNEQFKSMIIIAAEQCELEMSKGLMTISLVFLWMMTPWLGLYGIINRTVQMFFNKY